MLPWGCGLWNSITIAAPPGADPGSAVPRLPLARATTLATLLLAAPAAAGAAGLPFVPPLPANAEPTAESVQSPASAPIARGPWTGDASSLAVVEGEVTQRAWRLPASTATTLALLAPLRDALAAAGFTLLHDCATDACGGFDFRYAIPVLPEPEMHVDLGDFRYLAASRPGPDGPTHVALLVSRSKDAGFVQLLTVAPTPTGAAAALAPAPVFPAPDPAAAPLHPAPSTAAPPAAGSLAAALDTGGVTVLDGLAFPSGAAELAPGDYPSLVALAGWLAAHPDRQVTLVGHTDAQGSLAANIALSKRRAQSVADRLVADHGIAAARVGAEGAGYLAPRASNDTEEGRQKNRRVEAMITPTR